MNSAAVKARRLGIGREAAALYVLGRSSALRRGMDVAVSLRLQQRYFGAIATQLRLLQRSFGSFEARRRARTTLHDTWLALTAADLPHQPASGDQS